MSIFTFFSVLLAFLLVNCKSPVTEDTLLTINRTAFDNNSFEFFKEADDGSPTIPNEFFPGSRLPITYMVETEVIYRAASAKAKREVKESLEWKWRKHYYLTHNFTSDILANNLGSTDDDIRNYYNQNQQVFTQTIVTEDQQDSTVLLSFDEARPEIVNTLFISRNKPDSAFIAGLPDEIAQDSTETANYWLYYVRSDLQNFFMHKFFERKYGYPYSDTLHNLTGEEGILKQQDLDIIDNWDNENRFSQKEHIEWLLRWKLLSEKAKSIGFDRTEHMKALLDWALKIEFARSYIAENLIPALMEDLNIDSSLALYSYYDRVSSTLNPDSAQISREFAQIKNATLSMKVDSAIHNIRRRFSIDFLQSDWKDHLDKDPTLISAKGDSLRDEGKHNEALNQYKLLTENFLFTPEGKQALIEKAKIHMEKGNHLSAVRNYRRHQIVDSKGDCNSFFMIGFIYDENLKNPDLAEVNYRWIIENDPQCDLAQDTEFMLLHLDEQMSSITIEELQAQTRRQNRPVDLEEPLDL